MHACMCVSENTRRISIYVCMYVYVHASKHAPMYLCTYVSACVCTSVCPYLRVNPLINSDTVLMTINVTIIMYTINRSGWPSVLILSDE